jgi:hypothetical protein
MHAVKKMGAKTSLHHGPTHSNSEAHKEIPEDISIMQWLLRYGFYNEKSFEIFYTWLQTYTTSKYKQLETKNTIYIEYLNPTWIKEHLLLPVDFIVEKILFHNTSQDIWVKTFFDISSEKSDKNDTAIKNYQALKKGLKETFFKYITSEFIKILGMYGPNPAPTEDDPEYNIIKRFVTTYDEQYNVNKTARAAKNKTHTNCLGLAGIYFKYIPTLIRERFRSMPTKLLCHFPTKIKGRKLMDNIEMEPVFILTLGITEDGKRLGISGYFKQIIQGDVSFPKMSPTTYNNKNKKEENDEVNDNEVPLIESSEEENTLTDEDIKMKGEEGLENMKKLIKEVKVSKVTKANLKQYLQQINSYVNKLKQSNSATTPV